MNEVSAVILSHDRRADLEQNLRSLLDADHSHSLEIIVVDNASNDGTTDMLGKLASEYSSLTLILNRENYGVAGGRNLGFRKAQGKYIVCLDDDANMSGGDIARVPSIFESFPCAGILAFRVRHARTAQEQNNHGETPCPVANFHGAGHAFRREVFDRVGYLDELCTFGGEELDMSIRAHSAGFQTIYIPDVIVWHNSFSRPALEGAERREKWTYNYTRILFKHFPYSMALLFSLRYLAAHMLHGCRLFGFGFAFRMLSVSARGRTDGIRSHALVSEETIRFYRNPDLSPEFGNVPLLKKVFRKFNYRGAGSPQVHG